jgi:hypothetical protein
MAGISRYAFSVVVLVTCVSIGHVTSAHADPTIAGFDCGSWDGNVFLRAFEGGQSGTSYNKHNVLRTGIDPPWTLDINSNTAHAKLVQFSTCQIPQATVAGIVVHITLTGKAHIETHMHANDEDGVAWAPSWQGILHLPGKDPAERFDVDIGSDMSSYTLHRLCQITVGAQAPIVVNIFSPPQPQNEGHSQLMPPLAPGDYVVKLQCSPYPSSPDSYFLHGIGNHLNADRDERVDLDIVATFHQ